MSLIVSELSPGELQSTLADISAYSSPAGRFGAVSRLQLGAEGRRIAFAAVEALVELRAEHDKLFAARCAAETDLYRINARIEKLADAVPDKAVAQAIRQQAEELTYVARDIAVD